MSDEAKLPTPGGNPASWRWSLYSADGRELCYAAKPEHLEKSQKDSPGSTIGRRKPGRPEAVFQKPRRLARG